MAAIIKRTDVLRIDLSGTCTSDFPDGISVKGLKGIEVHNVEIKDWNSLTVAFIVDLLKQAKKENIPYSIDELPKGMVGLIDLALRDGNKTTPKEREKVLPLVDRFGCLFLSCCKKTKSVFAFMRETHLNMLNVLSGKSVMRACDFWWQVEEVGPNSLAIVSLICFMVGLIVAFVGSIQLKLFGAEIFVASLVGIAITRIMGAIMAGIIMAGRTGASFAATIGTMQVNEEVDALKTMGISPFEFLIAPRVLALSVVMPLLTLYADIMGMLGGAFVGVFLLNISPAEYFTATIKALKANQVLIGVLHGTVYGYIIAICGCYQGFHCARNAAAVGHSTTSAVVNSIVWMTIATSIMTIIFSIIGV
ncbi:MAG: ABC transporter permease [Alphaproteobacteria bacterium]|nr:ABC transporter permease [Alphaproteobacteria bacterium]